MAAACVGNVCRMFACIDDGDEGSCGVVACVVGAGVEDVWVDGVGVEGTWVDGVGVNEARGVMAWTAPAL